MVSLLPGHIQLHGLQQPDQAALSYEKVLKGEPDATIAALAKQGLERCRSQTIASKASQTPATNGAIPDLLKDPFLSRDADRAKPARADVVTAMPWLAREAEPPTMPTTDPSPTPTPMPAPVPSPKPTLTPEANSQAEMKKQEQEPTTEEPHSNTIEPTAQEPAATKLLEHSWLRVQLQPDIKSPIDSMEPMGLINGIKGVFSRSAGR